MTRISALILALCLLALSACGDKEEDSGEAVDLACVPCSGSFEILNEFDYQEARACQSISGSLELRDEGWLPDVDMPCLTTIGETLIISGEGIITVSFPNLVSVGSTMTMMTGVEDLDGLSSLETAGSLNLIANRALANIDGLASLAAVESDMRILSNEELLNLNGLQNLATVGDDMEIAGNDAIADLAGLGALTSVGGSLSIGTGTMGSVGNASLTEVGMVSLLQVGMDLDISNNEALCQSDAEAFAASVTVNGDVEVQNNGSDRTDCE